MRHGLLDSIPANAAPTTEDMLRVWRADRCVQDSTAGLYLQWIRCFRAYCAQCNLDERAELTLAGAYRFIAWYARHRHLKPQRLGGARTALYALRWGCACRHGRICGVGGLLQLRCCGRMPIILRIAAAIRK